MLSSILWGLIPPIIPSQFLIELDRAQKLGPKRVGDKQHQIALSRSFHLAMDSLSERVRAPQDARVHTQVYSFDLAGKLLTSLCR